MDLTELGQAVASREGEHRARIELLLADHNLEEAFTWLRRIRDLLEEGQEFQGYTQELATAVERDISRAVIETLEGRTVDDEPYRRLGAWVVSSDYHLPVEIFTLNYDLLLERAFEAVGVPYFDGFVGVLRARFRRDLVDPLEPGSTGLGALFARVWKLHGSLHWVVDADGERTGVTRLGTPAPQEQVAAIYPSEAKYEDSRRVPFVVLFDRFRRALEAPESILLISGYSFGDQHINEIIFEAALAHPRSETVALCFDEIPGVLRERAKVVRNLTVFARSGFIRGGSEGLWSQTEAVAGLWDGENFLLGDFANLVRNMPPSKLGDAGG